MPAVRYALSGFTVAKILRVLKPEDILPLLDKSFTVAKILRVLKLVAAMFYEYRVLQ